MTSWTNLSDADLTAGKPGTQAKFRALRDNPKAMAEGATGSPILIAKTGASLGLLDTAEANNTASQLVLTTGWSLTNYDAYLISIVNLLLASNDDALSLQTSTNGGASYDSGIGDYRWACTQNVEGTETPYGSSGDANIKLWGRAGGAGTGMTNDSAAGAFSGNIWVFNRNQSVHRRLIWEAAGAAVTTLAETSIRGSGRRISTTGVNAIRLFTELGGNIAAGVVRLYAIKPSTFIGNWP